MLDIPQKVAEPTPYHLLGIDPRVFSEDLVESALAERKMMLRQNIPGPQFIPMISLVEKELDRAAEILSDPGKRKALNDRLLGELRDKKAKKEKARRQKLRRAADKVIQGQVNRDGTLDDNKRQAVAKSLQDLGMSAADAQVVLEEIPRPMTKEEASPEALGYLAREVDTVLVGNVLTPEGEDKLMRLAKMLGIPKKQATETIRKCLAAKQATRGEADETVLMERFQKQVYKACPDGNVTDEHSAVLLRIAATIGLTTEAAEDVIEGCRASAATMVVPSEPSSAAPPTQPRTSVRASLSAELDQLAETQPMRPLTRVRVQPKTGPVSSNLKELAAGLGIPTPKLKSGIFVKLRKLAGPAIPVVGVIVFWTVIARHETEEAPVTAPPLSPSLPNPRPVPSLPTGQPQQQPPVPGLKKSVAALRTALLRPESSAEEVAAIVEGAKLTDLSRALGSASTMLMDDSNQLGTCLAERLFTHLIDLPDNPGTQARAVQGLINAIKATPDLARASRLANTVSLAIDLQPLKSEFTTNNERIAFQMRCNQNWNRSCSSSPQDPLNDPQRILSAILAGGDMMRYVKRVGSRQILDLTAQLAEISKTPGHEHAAKAAELITTIATWSKAPAELADAKKTAQLALCDRLRRAPDSDAARETFSTLAKMLGIRRRPRSSLFASLDGRKQLADEIEKVISSGEEPAKATFASAASGPTISGERIRSGFSSATPAKPEDLLLDVAVTMIAFCDRAMLFVSGYSACSSQLETAVANWDRGSWIDSRVKLPEPVSASAPAAAPRPARRFLDDARLKELAKEIKSTDQAIRYRAIDELAAGNTQESAEILLAEFRSLAAQHTDLTLPEPEIATDCRILAALGTMDTPKLGMELTGLITEVENPFFAHKITWSLCQMFQEKGIRPRTHVLPTVSTPKQRQMCQFRWKRTASRGHRISRQRPQPRRKQKKVAPPPWQPDPAKLRRMAAIVQYAELAADALKMRTWEGSATGELAPAPDTIFATNAAGQDMLRQIDRIGVQLARLVRKHPNGSEHATTADMVDLEKKARTLASDTTLQKIVVSLDAVGGLLEVLVQVLHPDGSRAQKLEALREKRNTAILTASNVIDQMRQSSYYNVLVFDLVFQPE